MKTKYWIAVMAFLLALSLGLSLLTLGGEDATRAEITSEGKLIRTVDLSVDQQFTIRTEDGYNVVTVKDGKIAVTDASCPDHYCMARGFCTGGTPIVCLPNRLVISFAGDQEVDALAGQ